RIPRDPRPEPWQALTPGDVLRGAQEPRPMAAPARRTPDQQLVMARHDIADDPAILECDRTHGGIVLEPRVRVLEVVTRAALELAGLDGLHGDRQDRRPVARLEAPRAGGVPDLAHRR